MARSTAPLLHDRAYTKSLFFSTIFTMRAILLYGLAFTFVHRVFCDDQSPHVPPRKLNVQKVKNDLDLAASGYIFRSDGDNPPIYIKLGHGNIDRYDSGSKNAGKIPFYFSYSIFSSISLFIRCV